MNKFLLSNKLPENLKEKLTFEGKFRPENSDQKLLEKLEKLKAKLKIVTGRGRHTMCRVLFENCFFAGQLFTL